MPEDDAAVGGPPQRIRKRRKVKVTKTHMEGKYLRTIDVDEWESYSEEEGGGHAAPPAKKAVRQLPRQ